MRLRYYIVIFICPLIKLFASDVIRSGLTDAQIMLLFDHCPKPRSFDPDHTAFSFRCGLVQVIPPLVLDLPEVIIDDDLLEWFEQFEKEQLTTLRDQIAERLNNFK